MWKDSTSYSQGQRGVKEPNAWTASFGDIRITVTCGHIDWGGEWIAHCHQINMSEIHLKGCKSAEEAKERAIVIVKARLQELHDMVSSITV